MRVGVHDLVGIRVEARGQSQTLSTLFSKTGPLTDLVLAV